MRRLLCFLLFLSIWVASFAQNEPAWFNVMAYGATADTSVLSTAAFQQALDAAKAAGGGTVYVPPGNFLCGSLRMYSHTTLHVEGGATIWASRRTEDYTHFGSKAKQPVLLYADSAHHLALIGKGRLHGQARRVYEDLQEVDGFIAEETALAQAYGVERKMYYKVAPWVTPVFLYHSTDITIEDISIIEGGFWLLDIKQSDRIFIRGAYLESSLDQGVNADGIDIDGCRDVVISDCIVITGDDAIVLKANYAKDANYHTENVTVSNCVVTSTSTGLKLGTESYGDYRHITFNNCVVRNSNRGLSIVVRDGWRRMRMDRADGEFSKTPQIQTGTLPKRARLIPTCGAAPTVAFNGSPIRFWRGGRRSRRLHFAGRCHGARSLAGPSLLRFPKPH